MLYSPIFFLFLLIFLTAPSAFAVQSAGYTTIQKDFEVDTKHSLVWILVSDFDGPHLITAIGNGLQYTNIPNTVELTEGKNYLTFDFQFPKDIKPDLYTINLHIVQKELPTTAGASIIEAAKKVFEITPIFPDQEKNIEKPKEEVKKEPVKPPVEKPIEKPVEKITKEESKETEEKLKDQITIKDTVTVKKIEAIVKDTPIEPKCKVGLESHTVEPDREVCIKESTYYKLIERGWQFVN